MFIQWFYVVPFICILWYFLPVQKWTKVLWTLNAGLSICTISMWHFPQPWFQERLDIKAAKQIIAQQPLQAPPSAPAKAH